MLKFAVVTLLAISALGYVLAQDVTTTDPTTTDPTTTDTSSTDVTTSDDLSSQTYTQPYSCPRTSLTHVFQFASPTGNLGNSHTYTSDDGSTTVTAYGYANGSPATASALYGKNAGTGETGLGMNTDAGNDHEIDKNHFVQLDLSKIIAVMTANSKITIQISSAQSGEGYQLYLSNTLGSRGSAIVGGSGTGPGVNSVLTYSFTPSAGTPYLSVTATGSGSAVNVLIYTLTFCRDCSFVVGDPQFIGLRGQSYQVHGVSGEVYNIVSDPDFQYNSRFVFLDRGDCPVVDGKKQKGCFSHPGSFLGELGFKTRAGDKIHIVSGAAQQGFQSIELNGKAMEIGETALLNGGLGSMSYNSTHLTAINIGKWGFTFENSDMFVNQRVQVANFKNLRSHGLLGQTWKDTTYPSALKFISGAVDDYAIRSNEIFGDDFVFNVFN